jgi:hypothetical protein
MTADISGLFFGSVGGPAVQTFMGGNLTAIDDVTYENSVAVGSVIYENCGIACDPAALVTGRVLLGMTAAGPVILYNLFQADE